MNYHNCKIAITGDLGSGKSAVSNILVEKLGFEYISTGNIQRSIAKRMGMTTLELNRHADLNKQIDKEIDSVFRSLQEDTKNYIADSRLAWHFLPNALKVYLTVDIQIASQRVRGDKNRKSEAYQSDEEAILQLKERKQSENDRFLKTYNVDCGNMENYDLVVDTSHLTPDEVAGKIIEALNQKAAIA